jgi:hypothetical protein
LKLAVIADRGLVPRFALEALNQVEGTGEVAVFSCTNTRLPRRVIKHGAYYALNLFTVRNPLTRLVPVSGGTKAVTSVTEFESSLDGAWQQLPEPVVRALGAFDVVLKFGMGLMRVPPPERLGVPILSYHHGDPDKFRGRPAGFWEIAAGEQVMGQMVQVIGNRLDAGRVVAFAETKVLPWSYRATLIESFRHSPLIINEAIRNALAGVSLGKPCAGRNWRLPSNVKLLSVLAAMTARRVRRLGYGALVEKRWQVSTAPAPADPAALFTGNAFPDASLWRIVEPASGYSFYADPFFAEQGLFVEALRETSGLGEIVLVRGGDHRRISYEPGHMSYPAAVRIDGREIIVPEMANWSEPHAYRLEDGRLHDQGPLQVGGGCRIADPTLLVRQGRVWLFGNDRDEGSNVLRLWSAPSIGQRFLEHPLSPIRISPEGARMAGSLIEHRGRLFRLGQDFRSGYGDGICAFEIEELDEHRYRERPLGRLAFLDRRGPHTLNIRGGEMAFDWYRDRVTPMAGLRRLLARASARRLRLR